MLSRASITFYKISRKLWFPIEKHVVIVVPCESPPLVKTPSDFPAPTIPNPWPLAVNLDTVSTMSASDSFLVSCLIGGTFLVGDPSSSMVKNAADPAKNQKKNDQNNNSTRCTVYYGSIIHMPFPIIFAGTLDADEKRCCQIFQ